MNFGIEQCFDLAHIRLLDHSGDDLRCHTPGQLLDTVTQAPCEVASANLSDESFEEFCRRQDLPDFDFIGLHGIWSWVSDKNRQVIVDFIRRKLKVGGVVYVSYNTQPGWAPMIQ